MRSMLYNSLIMTADEVSFTQGDFVLKIEPPLGWSFGKILDQLHLRILLWCMFM